MRYGVMLVVLTVALIAPPTARCQTSANPLGDLFRSFIDFLGFGSTAQPGAMSPAGTGQSDLDWLASQVKRPEPDISDLAALVGPGQTGPAPVPTGNPQGGLDFLGITAPIQVIIIDGQSTTPTAQPQPQAQPTAQPQGQRPEHAPGYFDNGDAPSAPAGT